MHVRFTMCARFHKIAGVSTLIKTVPIIAWSSALIRSV